MIGIKFLEFRNSEVNFISEVNLIETMCRAHKALCLFSENLFMSTILGTLTGVFACDTMNSMHSGFRVDRKLLCTNGSEQRSHGNVRIGIYVEDRYSQQFGTVYAYNLNKTEFLFWN